MANNRIQIKRSTGNSVVTGLNPGELAFTANGDVLYIGNPADGTSKRIGGLQSPGTLTANQALVANSTSGIDKVIVANAVVSTLWANGSGGNAGDILFSNGTSVYWLPSGEVSINTNAQYTWSNTQTFTGAILANTVNAVSYNVGSWVVANNSGVFTSGVVNGDIISVGSYFKANTTQVTIGSGVGLSVNGSVGTANQVLRSDGTSAFWSSDAGDISAVTAGDGLTGGGSSGDVTLDVGAGNGISVSADAVAVNTGANSGLVANGSGLFVAYGDGLTTNSSVLNVVGSDAIVSNSGGVFLKTGSTLTVNTGGVHVNNTLSITDLTLAGNLVINGSLTTVNTTNLSVTDPLIKLANGNSTTDSLDIGFYGLFGSSGTKYTGLYHEHSSDIYRLFTGATVEPTTTVDRTNASIAILEAFVQAGGLVTNSSVVNITANSSVAVTITANTLTLSSPLAATSGGTGLNTYTSGDLLVANTGNALSTLGLGTSGYVLQSNGSALVYDYLDGGTF